VRNRVQDEAIEWSEIEELDVNLWKLTLEVVAETMGVHRTTAGRRLRRKTGRTWREHKSGVREEEAKQLLSDRRLSVKEVAHLLEFGSASAFSRFFEKRTGVRPSKWCIKRSREKP
jgi:AraC-like DNA-binding protein